jgi:hypothetical protein
MVVIVIYKCHLSEKVVAVCVQTLQVQLHVEDCRTRASGPPQTHVRYKAVDGPSSRYTA